MRNRREIERRLEVGGKRHAPSRRQNTPAPGEGVGDIPVPAWFDWTPSFSIRKVGSLYVPSVTAADLKPAAGTTLYVSSTGSNANNGTTIALAKRSIANAYNAGATTIIGADTSGVVDYTRTNGFEGITLANRDLIIESLGATMVIARFEPPASLTWVQDGTYPNVYTATRSTTVTGRDRAQVDANGNIAKLTPQVSIAAVAGAPGSIYINGSTISVSRIGGGAPGSDILLFLSGNNGLVTNVMAGKTAWIGPNVEFWGGDAAFATSGLASTDGTRVVADRVKFKYATNASTGNGFLMSNLDECYVFGCQAEANNLDGFNYHYADAGIGTVLEVDCIGRDNGDTGASNNGSTIHEAGQIIRLNGLYIANEGPQVADTNTAQSWNLGCRASGGATNWSALLTAEMTLDDCSSDDGTTDLSVAVGAAAYTRNFTSGGVITGTPTPY